MIYYIADLHFGHSNIIKLCGRPYADAYEMDCAMVDNWNSVVDVTDDVYIVGDFCFGSKRPVTEYLYQRDAERRTVYHHAHHKIHHHAEYHCARNGERHYQRVHLLDEHT